jgi:ComF family protein
MADVSQMGEGGGQIKRQGMGLVRDLWSGLLDLVYPPKCLVCGDMQPEYFCEACRAEIVFIQPPVCSRCGAPIQDGPCAECFGIEYAFDAARAVGVYDGPLREAIHQLKYSGHRVLAPVLGGLLVDHLRGRSGFIQRIGCIVPMPIHTSRRRQRGFNQSALLAEPVGRAFALPVVERALIRTHATRPQVDLPIEMRRENVEGAFQVAGADAVAGRSVLLIDDVFTTGSTADSAARALRDAGAREIHVLTLARSV